MITATPRLGVLATAALLALACAPPKIGSQDDEGGSSESDSGLDGTEGSSSSSSGDTTETTSDAEASDGTSFVPPNDLALPIDCDPWAQDCPEGEKCVPYASTGGNWDAHKCVPVLGDQAPGEPCSYTGAVEATDDCDAEGICWDVMDVGGELVGVCREFCAGSPDDPTCPDIPGCSSQSCLIGGSSVVNLCVPSCDPLAQGCSEGLGCFWVQDSFDCVFTTEELPTGDPCGFVNDCQPGAICLDAAMLPECAGESCCASFCDTADDFDPCPGMTPGTACLPFDTGQDDCSIGICRLP